MSLNKVMLIGNVTRDPQLKYTPKNTAVCSFGLATNRVWVDFETKEKQEQVEFHNINTWSKLAEICGSLLHKGDKVYLEGRIQTRGWKGDDGVERKTTEIVAENLILLKSAAGFPGQQAAQPSKGKSAKAVVKDTVEDSSDEGLSAEFDAEDVSDDVPF